MRTIDILHVTSRGDHVYTVFLDAQQLKAVLWCSFHREFCRFGQSKAILGQSYILGILQQEINNTSNGSEHRRGRVFWLFKDAEIIVAKEGNRVNCLRYIVALNQIYE